MAAFPTLQPPPPPEVRQQMQPPMPMMMRPGLGGGPEANAPAPSPQEVLGLLADRVQKLEEITGEIHKILQVVHPPTAALLVPIAQAGAALKAEVVQLQQAAGGAGPAQGPPEPTPTPAGAPPNAPMT